MRGLSTKGTKGTEPRRITQVGSRTLTVEKLTLFSLAHLFNVPCALSGKTSLKIPVRVRAALRSRTPRHGAITRYCRRILGSLGSTLKKLAGRGRSTCVGC